jgi:uncharacterized membrane protein YedE/YeeE
MSTLLDLLRSPWPWWIAGPAIGLVVPMLLLASGRRFGLSSAYRHLCSAARVPGELFRYDWRRIGGWNLILTVGIVLGGLIAGTWLASPEPLAVADATARDLAALGVTADGELAPQTLFSFAALSTPAGWIVMILGGFLIGFGARWAAGCTSGHAIMGLAEGRRGSLIAVIGFFAGGLAATYGLLPLVLR